MNYLFKDCVDYILESAEEARKYPKGDYKDGSMLAYAAVLRMIKHKIEILTEDDIADYGLDFDVDKRYIFDSDD